MRRPIGLRLRLVILLAVFLLGLVAGHVFLLAKNERDVVFSVVKESTARLSNTVRRSTRHAMLHSRREDVHRMIDDIGDQPGIEHVRIFNKDGRIVYSADEEEIGQLVDRKVEGCIQCHDTEVPREQLGMAQRVRIFAHGGGERVMAATEGIYNEPACWTAECHAHFPDETVLGIVDVGISLEGAERQMAQAARYATVIGLVWSVAICVVLGWTLQVFVIKRVHRLLEGTRRVAEGDLDYTLPVTSRDELGELAASFNQMTAELRSARGALRDWGEKLAEEVDRKTAELRAAQAQILRSEKLSSVGLLAAGVAHELNSPLMGILTFAHLLEQRFPEGSPERRDLQVIIQQANRCAIIIRQLLDFSRERPPERQFHDVHQVLNQALDLVGSLAQFRPVQVERDFADDLPEVAVDASQMQQVFLNLLVNAGEAMPQGGKLTIRTRRRSPWPPDHRDGEAVEITFRDTGVGIPNDVLDKIFDPFFTSKEVGKGTGLGLAVSHGIVERHGGTIEVESRPGEGTAFTVILPAGKMLDSSEDQGTVKDRHHDEITNPSG